jgi:hypothetical protein
MPEPQTPLDPADPRLLSVLTTEHSALQSSRFATISDSSSRASLYLGALSGALVALSLLGNATRLGPAFVVAALVLAPTLVFLGHATFVRVLESAVEDFMYGRGINRIRHYYLEVAPQLRPYLIQSDRDDGRGVMYNMGLAPDARNQMPHNQMLFTTASTVGIINSVLAGAFAGGLLSLLPRVGLAGAFIGAAVVALLCSAAYTRMQRRAWSAFSARVPVQFPTDGPGD